MSGISVFFLRLLHCLFVSKEKLCLCHLLLARLCEDQLLFQEWVSHFSVFERVLVREGELVNRHIPFFIRKVVTSADFVID